MIAWEYRVVAWKGSQWTNKGDWVEEDMKGFSSEQMLQHVGKEGWELVSLGPVHGQALAVSYIFKRPAR